MSTCMTRWWHLSSSPSVYASEQEASEEEEGEAERLERACTHSTTARRSSYIVQIPLADSLQSLVERCAQNRAKRAGEVAAVFDPERLAWQDLGQPLRLGAFTNGDERSVHLRVAGEAAAEILSADAVCRRANLSGSVEQKTRASSQRSKLASVTAMTMRSSAREQRCK